jgi:hypothetical protein
MTEYEGVTLFLEFLNTSIQLVLAYVSILSAFLIMSYFSADKLNGALTLCVIVLFSIVCFLLMTQLYLVRNDMAHLMAYLLTEQNIGAELPWFGNNAGGGVPALTVLHFLVTVGGYFGCIAYFFYQRFQKGT